MGKLLSFLKAGQATIPAQRQPRVAEGQLVPITIVGESGYQGVIKAIKKQAGGREFVIVLRPEPQNPYDANAVSIQVDGNVVGYMPRDLAKQWQPVLLAAESEGYVVQGKAAIYGGTKDKPSLGVFGEATWPHGATPPRATPHRR